MSKEDISHDTAKLLVRQADWEIRIRDPAALWEKVGRSGGV